MQVTLKKAAALATALGAATDKFVQEIEISKHTTTPIRDIVEEARSELEYKIDDIQCRIQAHYQLRDLIGKANEGEINELLTKRARIDKQLGVLELFPLRDHPDYNVLEAKRTELRNGTSKDRYDYSDSIKVQLPTEGWVPPMVSHLKRERLAVEDRLAELNFTTKIELPDDVVRILRAYDLV